MEENMSLSVPQPKPTFVPTNEPPLNTRGRFQPSKRRPLAMSQYCPPPPRVVLKPKSPLQEAVLRAQGNVVQTLSPEQKEERRRRKNIECSWANAFRRQRRAKRKQKERVLYERQQPTEAEELDVFWDVLHRVHSLNVGDRFLECQ